MNCQRGFSLLETMVALSLFLLLFALCVPFLRLQGDLWARQESYREEFDTLNWALSWICRDLREAGYRCEGPPVREMEEASITYVLSRDGADPSVFSESSRRLVGVYRQGNDLMYSIRRWDPAASRWERGSVQKLASNVADLRFRGFDGSGRPVATAAEVKAVEITLRGGLSGTFTSYVAIRNGYGQ